MTMPLPRNYMPNTVRSSTLSDTPKWRVTLADVSMDHGERTAVTEALESGWLSMGPRVKAFEKAFACYHGVEHAIATSSGTAALHLSLMALNIQPGDEVIQPAINFVAGANMTRAVGARPVFVDIAHPQRPIMEPDLIKAAITPRTRAIIVLHYGGYPAPIEEITRLADENGIKVIEDACHAPATPYGSQALGTWGSTGCFSFFPNKNMTTAEGGMVVTRCSDTAERIGLLRSHGMTTLTWERHRGHASNYDVATPGFNYRLDELRAALGTEQVKRLPNSNARRRDLTDQYRRRFASYTDVDVVFNDFDGCHAGHLFVVLVPAETRSMVISACRSAGIQTSMHYPCITRFSAYRDSTAVVPNALSFAERAVTLPLHPGLSSADIDLVAATVTKALSTCRSVV